MSNLPRYAVGVGAMAAAAALALTATRTLFARAAQHIAPQALHNKTESAAPPPSQITVEPSPPAVEAPSTEAAASSPASALRPFAWAVFWDLENVCVPRGVSGETIVHTLRHRLCALHPSSAVVRIVAVGNMLRLPIALRNQLQANGVTLVHVETRGRKDAADKALIAELCLLPAEHEPPFGVALLSGDGDFCYALARMRHLGYQTVVVASTKGGMCSALLESVPHVVWGLREDVLAVGVQEGNPVIEGDCGEVARLRRRVEWLTRDVADAKRARVKAEGKVGAVEVDRKVGKKKRAQRKKKQQSVQRANPDVAAGGIEGPQPAALGPAVQGDKPGHSRDVGSVSIHSDAKPAQNWKLGIPLFTMCKWVKLKFVLVVWCVALPVIAKDWLRQGEVMIAMFFLVMYIARTQVSYDALPAASIDNAGQRVAGTN